MRNPVLAAAVVSSVLLAGLVVWHSRSGSDDDVPAVALSAPDAGTPDKHSRIERGGRRSSAAAQGAASADALERIHQCMQGCAQKCRHAGWIEASIRLGRQPECFLPDAIHG